MLEPFLMLTVLNCFFMFSSTVTTCALWWQYGRHGQSSHGEDVAKVKINKSKSCEDRCLRDESKSSNKKRGKTSFRAAKESKKDKKTKSGKRSKEGKVKCVEKLTSTEDVKHGPGSPSLEAKSTVVMELSTVQKVVQVFDKDNQHTRMPNETVTYRFSPDNQRKVEFIVNSSKSEDRTKSMQKIDHSNHLV